MAYNEALATRIRAQLAGSAGVSEKRMFGGLAFLKNGNMFVGVTGDELMARVGKENYADSLARKHVREMDFTGKPLAGYVFVGAQGIAKDTDLGFWVERCQAFAETLPAKAKR
ncbi:MAG TPA: TfoX/Sxy family protein [Thermoanaerobaculia bacterium]|jgi:hypothetical protein